MLSASLSVLCDLPSSSYPAEILPPVVTHWGSLRTEMPQLFVLMHGVKSCTRWKSNSELFFSAAVFSILMSPLRHPCLSVVIRACCSFHWNRTTGNCSCHSQSIKKLHLDYMFWSFPKKDDADTGDSPQAYKEENSLFVPTSVQNKVGMVTLVNSALEPSRSESERPTITEAFFGKQFWIYFHLLNLWLGLSMTLTVFTRHSLSKVCNSLHSKLVLTEQHPVVKASAWCVRITLLLRDRRQSVVLSSTISPVHCLL